MKSEKEGNLSPAGVKFSRNHSNPGIILYSKKKEKVTKNHR
jgi:hypothetical protein